jgi:hypothetical protein
MFIRFLTPFYVPDTDQGSGGAAVTPAEPAQQPQQGYTRLLERNGNDAGAVATLLYQENYQHRQRIRDLEGRLPKEGAVILSGDDVARWDALRAHNPADVAAALAERDTLKAQVTETARKETIRKAADAAGLKASVLERLPGLPPVEVTEADGKAIAHVVTDAGKVPLIDYVTSQFADFLPALQLTQQQTTGAPWPRQPTGGAQRPADPVDSALATFQAARDSRPNPLAPKTK